MVVDVVNVLMQSFTVEQAGKQFRSVPYLIGINV